MGNQNVLLVEGKDDLYVIAALLQHHLNIDKIENFITIKDKEGFQNLLFSVSRELRAEDLKSLGIVIDADTDIEANWMAIRNRLKLLNAEVPDKPDPDGTISDFTRADDQKIRIGIWIMPDNKVPGTLEDFVAFLIPGKDMLWKIAKDCVEQTKQALPFEIENKELFSWQKKAEIHTWLAWQEKPGKPLGTAISSRYLDAGASHAEKLTNWLRRLFDPKENSD